VLGRYAALPVTRAAWGTGEEVRIPSDRSPSHAEESLFFDQDDRLVGQLFIFPNGLDLKPYPVLRDTLGKLKPAIEFYLNIAQVAAMPARETLDPSSLYETGDATSTTRYLVLNSTPRLLLAASFAIDPYAKLMSPYRSEFLVRIERADKTRLGQPASAKGYADKEPFTALQQFARGEAAHFGLCGARDDTLAADAYNKAITIGFTDKLWQAEAHHKLGLALERSGKIEAAIAALQKALAIRPNTAELLNSLGSVYAKSGDQAQAVKAFERAVTLRPNYPMARFNLAESYERVNARRAIAEYETYLALVEGSDEDPSRIAKAMERVQQLKQR
jgi:tetratricopeptide (TPR) repeat protein